MIGKFMLSADTPQETLDWGKLKWMSSPPATGAGQLTVIEVSLAPGHGHNFHKHPDQEEVIYCVAGEVEQWLGKEKRVMGPGDSVFIGADVVHATFNIGDHEATLLAILGPCVGDMGYEIEDVADKVPWNGLR
ncbi:cupin domain-containing protein [Ruegeria lacuscaerulensis]|uniref:cupin domain-containing protein n=1 Tax=Ruegeria lacuscaerulensis TaxID=55218 RepID=UPI001479A44A|nr:cupin domain-containing protein [Ruegeria lacuscaerulensis]